MRIRAVSIRNLRSIRSADLTFEDVTVLIGGNNAGKSTILYALKLFFDSAPKISADDFHKREAESIEVILTFENLTAHETEEFGAAVYQGKLIVSRTFSNDKETNLSYSVRAPSYPPFEAVRSQNGKSAQKTAFNTLSETIEGLSKVSTGDQALEAMEAWEKANTDKLEFSYVRGFFGASNVANGKLRKKTNLHFIPAVANVTDETSDAKRSPIINLLADIARQTFENRQEVKEFIETALTNFNDLIAPEKFPQLGAISTTLTSTIQKYYSDSRLLADWKSEEGIKFSFPQPVIRVEDSGFLSGLEHVGHGLQRACCDPRCSSG